MDPKLRLSSLLACLLASFLPPPCVILGLALDRDGGRASQIDAAVAALEVHIVACLLTHRVSHSICEVSRMSLILCFVRFDYQTSAIELRVQNLPSKFMCIFSASNVISTRGHGIHQRQTQLLKGYLEPSIERLITLNKCPKADYYLSLEHPVPHERARAWL